MQEKACEGKKYPKLTKIIKQPLIVNPITQAKSHFILLSAEKNSPLLLEVKLNLVALSYQEQQNVRPVSEMFPLEEKAFICIF